jgi:hypothetical protein
MNRSSGSSGRPGSTWVSPAEGVAPDTLRFFVRAGLLPDASPEVEVTPVIEALEAAPGRGGDDCDRARLSIPAT